METTSSYSGKGSTGQRPAGSPGPAVGLEVTRRGILAGAGGVAIAAMLPAAAVAQAQTSINSSKGETDMSSGYITTKDGTQIFYKDWGPKDAQPIVFHHGWPLQRRRLGHPDAVLPGAGLPRHRP